MMLEGYPSLTPAGIRPEFALFVMLAVALAGKLSSTVLCTVNMVRVHVPKRGSIDVAFWACFDDGKSTIMV